LSRVINPELPGKKRTQLSKNIIFTIKALQQQTEFTDETRDMLAYIALTLREIQTTIEPTVTAWEKRDYWLKADRFRLEWEWTATISEKLSAALIKDKLDEIPALIIKIMDKLRHVKMPARAPKLSWNGQWELMSKNDTGKIKNHPQKR
jgi:hypothetical protein